MKNIFAVFLAGLMALSSTVAVAAKPDTYLASGPGFQVTVTPSVKCDSKAVAAILKKYKAGFKIDQMFKARVLFEGKAIDACGMEQGGAVLIVGEDGNGTVVPGYEFEKLTEI